MMGDNGKSSAILSDSTSPEVASQLTSSLNALSSSINQRSRKLRTPRSLSQMSEEYADEPIDEEADEDDEEEDEDDEPLDDLVEDEDEDIEEDLDDADRHEDVVSSALDAKLLQQLEASGASEQLKQLLNSSLLTNSSSDARSQLVNALMNSGAEMTGLDASTLASLAAAITNVANSSSGTIHSPASNGSHMSGGGSPPPRSLTTIRKRRSQSQHPTTTNITTSSIDLGTPLGDSLDLTSGSAGSGGRSKVFECKVCHHRFGYKHVLQNHERIHTGTFFSTLGQTWLPQTTGTHLTFVKVIE
jgi:hypothetical protein